MLPGLSCEKDVARLCRRAGMSLMVFALSYALAGVRVYPNLLNRGRNQAPLVAHTQTDRARESCTGGLGSGMIRIRSEP